MLTEKLQKTAGVFVHAKTELDPAIFKETEFDLVLLEVATQDENELESIKRIKKRSRMTEIILMNGNSDSAFFAKAFALRLVRRTFLRRPQSMSRYLLDWWGDVSLLANPTPS